MYVCSCKAVSSRTIARLASEGARSTDIARLTGAGTVCGTCRPVILALLEEYAAVRPVPAGDHVADSREPLSGGRSSPHRRPS